MKYFKVTKSFDHLNLFRKEDLSKDLCTETTFWYVIKESLQVNPLEIFGDLKTYL